jgi:hypothetical protein
VHQVNFEIHPLAVDREKGYQIRQDGKDNCQLLDPDLNLPVFTWTGILDMQGNTLLNDQLNKDYLYRSCSLLS